jgi:hypothetical protein
MTTRTEEVRRTRAFAIILLSIFALMSVVSSQMLIQPVAANTQQSFTGYNAPTPAECALPALPATADFTLSYMYPTPASTVSYLTMNILSPASISGQYPSWCASTAKPIVPGFDGSFGPQVNANVYSSYDTAKFAGEFLYPGNMGGPVNWLLNQNFIGTESSCTHTQYTWSDIELAIWILTGGPNAITADDLSTLGPYEMARANCLVQAALQHQSFYPQCGQSIAILLVPTDGSQDLIIQLQRGLPSAVGGTVSSVDDVALLSPWIAVIGLVGCMATVGVFVKTRRR